MVEINAFKLICYVGVAGSLTWPARLPNTLYYLDYPNTIYIYKDCLRNRVIILGYNKVIVRVALLGLDRKTYLFIITNYYTSKGYSKLFSI